MKTEFFFFLVAIITAQASLESQSASNKFNAFLDLSLKRKQLQVFKLQQCQYADYRLGLLQDAHCA